MVPEACIDPDIIAPCELRALNAFDVNLGKKVFHDFNETEQRSPIKKLSGVNDFRLIKEPNLPNKEERAMKDNKDYVIGGIKMNILDIQALKNMESPRAKTEAPSPAKSTKKKKGAQAVSPAKGLVDGMSSNAYATFMKQVQDMTKGELGVGEKEIIIPSFHTTSKLFAQHFQILRELKHRIDLLKQAYEDQRSWERSWDQIDQILDVLAQGCHYLDFPGEKQIQKMMRQESVEE